MFKRKRKIKAIYEMQFLIYSQLGALVSQLHEAKVIDGEKTIKEMEMLFKQIKEERGL